jgi:hypothetical protein
MQPVKSRARNNFREPAILCSLFVLNMLQPPDAARKFRASRLRLASRQRGPAQPGGAVVYRKGELSKGMMDRQWPHQVALPAMRCHGHNYITIRLFCEPLSLCPRTHSFRRDDDDFIVFCFVERADAERFRDRFGGEFIDPKSRPKWPGVK